MTPQIIPNYREARLIKTSNCYSKRGMSFIGGIHEVLGDHCGPWMAALLGGNPIPPLSQSPIRDGKNMSRDAQAFLSPT